MEGRSVATLCILLACGLVVAAVPAKADVIGAYFGWNYVADSASPPTSLDLTQITYTGGNTPTAGLTANMPAFSGYSGMPDGVGLSYTPSFTTISGGDGETTRSVGQKVAIDWVPGGVVTPWGTYDFPTIAITNFTMADGRYYTLDSNTQNQASTSLPYYVLGLITDAPPFGPPYTLPLPSNDELLSYLLAPRGDIYDGFAGAVGNPQLTATDTAGFGNDQITVIFGAAVPEPASFTLLGLALAGFSLLRLRRG